MHLIVYLYVYSCICVKLQASITFIIHNMTSIVVGKKIVLLDLSQREMLRP